MPEIHFYSFTLYIPTINNHTVVYEKGITFNGADLSSIASTLGSLSDLRAGERITEEDLNNFIAAGYNVEDDLIDSSTSSFVERINEDSAGRVPYNYETLSAQLATSTVGSPIIAYLDKSKLETYLATLPTPITPSDTPLISMILVDDENSRTTFNGPIINDFTITEDLQEKITQLTALATNIGNLQTRLQNIINILNTQNIEFTDNISDVSSAGSKLYIQPQYYLKLVNDTSGDIRYINITPYVTGKYNFTMSSQYSLTATVSLKLDTEFNFNEWKLYNNIGSNEGLTVQSDGTVGNITNITLNGILSDSTLGTNGVVLNITRNSGDTPPTPADTCIINITFTK